MRDMTIERHMSPRPALPPRSEEYIDISGHLRVPCASSMERAPAREGWEAFFVNVNLADPIQKVCIYKRATA
jgi:hypothetical protein